MNDMPTSPDESGPALAPEDAALIDEFCDALWLEDGLSKNTLEAYRRDLKLFARWQMSRGGSLDSTSMADLSGYLGALSQMPSRARAAGGAKRGVRAVRNERDGLFHRGGNRMILPVVESGAGYSASFNVGIALS